MVTTTVRQKNGETVVELGGSADLLPVREENKPICENEDQISEKAKSGGVGQPVIIINNIFIINSSDPPHGKPPADRPKRAWKKFWKSIFQEIPGFIAKIIKALFDDLFGAK